MQRLFVYGSLRKGMQHAMFAFISRYFILQGEALVKGKLYDLGEYPGAVPGDEEHLIKGELYEGKSILEFNYAIEQLDDYEGVQAKSGKAPLFRREQATVYLKKETSTAWIYWYNRNIEGRTWIESGDWLQWKKENK